jgi:hypothetical protein
LLNARERIFNGGRQCCAFVCENQSPGGAPEEGRAEMILKCLHLMAHSGLSHTQLFGRARKAQMARRSFESPQGVQGEFTQGH